MRNILLSAAALGWLVVPLCADDTVENGTAAELSALLTGTSSAAAAAPSKPEILRENLVNNSPFRAIRWNQRVSSGNQPLELRGFAGSGDNLQVSLTDPRTRECQWVRVRDDNARWYVESADANTRTAVVRMDGIAINLEIAKASEVPIPITSRYTPTVPAVTVTATPQNPQQNQQQNQQQRGQQQGQQPAQGGQQTRFQQGGQQQGQQNQQQNQQQWQRGSQQRQQGWSQGGQQQQRR